MVFWKFIPHKHSQTPKHFSALPYTPSHTCAHQCIHVYTCIHPRITAHSWAHPWIPAHAFMHLTYPLMSLMAERKKDGKKKEGTRVRWGNQWTKKTSSILHRKVNWALLLYTYIRAAIFKYKLCLASVMMYILNHIFVKLYNLKCPIKFGQKKPLYYIQRIKK